MQWLIRLLRLQVRRLASLHWGWRAAFGLLMAGLGLVVLTRPLESLTLLVALVAVSLLLEGLERVITAPRSLWRELVGGVLIAAAVVMLAWPAITLDALAVVVSASLLVHGIHEVMTGSRERGSARAGQLMSGSASVVFGLLVLVWPDVTLLVVGVAFGLRLVGFGLPLALRAWRERTGPAGHPGSEPHRHRPGKVALAGRGVVLACALALLAGSIVLHRETPHPTAAYIAPEDQIPDRPGRLIKSTAYTHGVPDGARGWLILYTTTDGLDRPRTSSAFVMAPREQSEKPRDVVLWDHGTEGADIDCAPTLLPAPLPLAEPIAALEQQLEQGRVLVGPDYAGMGTPGDQSYLIGEAEGRSSLDAVRAARQIESLHVARRTVVWGHSQGGHAALWTGALARRYAPGIEVLGVAAAAPATDVRELIPSLADGLIGKIMGSFVVRAYSETYDDVSVDDYIDPRMRLIYDAMSRRCIPLATTLVSLLTSFAARGPMYSTDPSGGALGRRLDENVPRGRSDTPVLIGQGADDELVLPAMQDGYVKQRCAAGQPIDYRTYEGRGHLSLVADDSPFADHLLAWTDDRFAGKPARGVCSAPR